MLFPLGTSTCSERTRGNLGEVFVSKLCLGTPVVLGRSSSLSHDVTRAQPRSQGLSSLAPGGKMRDPGNEVDSRALLFQTKEVGRFIRVSIQCQ